MSQHPGGYPNSKCAGDAHNQSSEAMARQDFYLSRYSLTHFTPSCKMKKTCPINAVIEYNYQCPIALRIT